MSEDFACENCGSSVERAEATRTETYGNLDRDAWQVLCCPHCGERLQTVFVGDE